MTGCLSSTKQSLARRTALVLSLCTATHAAEGQTVKREDYDSYASYISAIRLYNQSFMGKKSETDDAEESKWELICGSKTERPKTTKVSSVVIGDYLLTAFEPDDAVNFGDCHESLLSLNKFDGTSGYGRPFFEYELVKQWRYKSVTFEHSIRNDKTEIVAVSASSQAFNASGERLLIFSVKDDIKYIDLQGRFISATESAFSYVAAQHPDDVYNRCGAFFYSNAVWPYEEIEVSISPSGEPQKRVITEDQCPSFSWRNWPKQLCTDETGEIMDRIDFAFGGYLNEGKACPEIN